MKRSRRWLAVAALLAGCTSHELTAVDPRGEGVFSQTFTSTTPRELDLLFVIDSSGSMAEEQSGLMQAFPRFVEALEDLEPLSWRIGIVTTDLGASGYALPGCSEDGDGGELLDGATYATCGYAGRWLEKDGEQTNAIGGDVETGFQCIATVGVQGCAFEMPMGAVRRALDGSLPANQGFLRPDSVVAVVIVTDEDDCTAIDPSFLDPADPTMGPVSSYRCFKHGVVCGQPGVEGQMSEWKECAPGGVYQEDPLEFVSFLRGLRPDHPDHVVLAVIAGPPAPVVVSTDGAGRPVLMPSCSSVGFGTAVPAVRLAAAVEAMGEGALFSTLCDGDLTPALKAVGDKLAVPLTAQCLARAPADVDPAEPGLQAECAVVADGVPLPRCRESGQACYAVIESASCPSGYSLSARGMDIFVSCVADSP